MDTTISASQTQDSGPSKSGRVLEYHDSISLFHDCRTGRSTLFIRTSYYDKDQPAEDIIASQKFVALMQGHRESIQQLELYDCNLGSLNNLMKLVNFFPSLATLRLESCSLGFTSMDQVSGHDYSEIPSISLSIKQLILKTNLFWKPYLIFDVLALATWLAKTSEEKHLYTVGLTMPFDVTSIRKESRQATAQILAAFGSRLTAVRFNFDFASPRDNLSIWTRDVEVPWPYPDFSNNRNLRILKLDFTSLYSNTPSILSAILNTISPSKLAHLGVSVQLSKSTVTELNAFEINDALVQSLSCKKTYASLKSVNLYVESFWDMGYFRRARLWSTLEGMARTLYTAGLVVKFGLDGRRSENFLGLPLTYLYRVLDHDSESESGPREMISKGEDVKFGMQILEGRL